MKKTLTLRKTEGKRRGQQKMTWVDSITDLMDVSLHKLQEMVKDRGARHTAVRRIAKSQTQLSN